MRFVLLLSPFLSVFIKTYVVAFVVVDYSTDNTCLVLGEREETETEYLIKFEMSRLS